MIPFKKIDLAKAEALKECKTCDGNGCRHCIIKVERINAWANSDIPVQFWHYGLETFPGNEEFKRQIESLSNNIDHIYKNGSSYIFSGQYGVGKTFGSTYILKKAIEKGYSCRFITMNDMINKLLSKDEKDLISTLLLSDFVCLDELDSRFVPTTERGQEVFGSNVEYIIRSRFQNKMPTIFCTNNNNTKDIFTGIFGQTLNSLFSSNNVSIITVRGMDLRKATSGNAR